MVPPEAWLALASVVIMRVPPCRWIVKSATGGACVPCEAATPAIRRDERRSHPQILRGATPGHASEEVVESCLDSLLHDGEGGVRGEAFAEKVLDAATGADPARSEER